MIRRLFLTVLLSSIVCACTAAAADDGWITLFDGTAKSFNNWKASENKNTWSLKDGMLVTNGPRSHLFYVGPLQNSVFRNFEFKAEIKTTKGSNSGIYFHTAYQEKNWPDEGYEVQVNNTHSDWRKTGGLYAVEDNDVRKSPAADGEWFTEHIIVQGGRITIKVNDKTTVDWTQPPNYKHPRFPGRKLGIGTFALQGHDPKSIVYYKNIKVKPLPGPIKVAVLTGGHGFQRPPFLEMLNSFKGMKCTEIQLKDHSEIFENILNWDYEVIVMYNMTQDISKKRKDNFKNLLDRGIGLVCLHHNMGAYQQWPEFKKIAGGKYYLKPTKEGNQEHRGSTYKHDIDMEVKIADSSHPITKGLKDFKIHDEGYRYCGFEKDNHVLLTVDHPESDKTVCWTRNYGRARICGLQLGHDGKAYANPNYRKVLSRAILWTAGRLK